MNPGCNQATDSFDLDEVVEAIDTWNAHFGAEHNRAQADALPVADDARIRAIKDAVWAECEGFELMDEEARRILSALDSLTRGSAATEKE